MTNPKSPILKKKYKEFLDIITEYFKILIVYYYDRNASQNEKQNRLNHDVNKYIKTLNKKEMKKERNRMTNIIQNRKLMIKVWNEIKKCELVDGEVNYPSCDDPNADIIKKPRSDFDSMFFMIISLFFNLNNEHYVERIGRNYSDLIYTFTYKNEYDRYLKQIDDFFISQKSLNFDKAKKHVLEINFLLNYLGFMHLFKNFYDSYDKKKLNKLSEIYIYIKFCKFKYTDDTLNVI